MRINVIYKELRLLSFLNMNVLNVLNDDTLQISALWHYLFETEQQKATLYLCNQLFIENCLSILTLFYF